MAELAEPVRSKNQDESKEGHAYGKNGDLDAPP
jgi:hypothetical protein